jgi:hypothetical protein
MRTASRTLSLDQLVSCIRGSGSEGHFKRQSSSQRSGVRAHVGRLHLMHTYIDGNIFGSLSRCFTTEPGLFPTINANRMGYHCKMPRTGFCNAES